MKKILSIALVVVLLAGIAVSGTMAYLQDTDSDVNVMTLGNVSIEQHEYQRAEGVAYNAGEAGAGNGIKKGDLVAFKQGQALLPAVPKNNAGGDYTAEGTDLFYWGDYVYTGTAGNGLWNDNNLSNVMDKMVFVENTGKSDAYFRTIIAYECPEGITIGEPAQGAEIMVNVNGSDLYIWENNIGYITVDGIRYAVVVATYKDALKPGDQAHPSLLQVVMTHHATNEDMKLLGDEYTILVLSQAVQTAGFDSADAALDAAFYDVNEENCAAWFAGDEFKAPTAVATAEELTAALAAGESVYLTADIENINANNAITVAAGKNFDLNLNGHKITATANKTGNQELFLVKGEMTVSNGTVEVNAENNQGWNAMATAFDVTAGGVLNLDGVTVKVSGTDMNFGVHLNNWGEVTLNANNCVFDTTYCAVRAFNSGPDMNNITIKNSTLNGATRAFWVHNYTSEDMGGKVHSGASAAYDKAAVDARLNLDIYGNGNTFTITGTAKSPIRYGMNGNAVCYFDADGKVVE